MIDWNKELTLAAARALSSIPAENLEKAIRYSLLAGGKLYRPKLMEASAILVGTASSPMIPFAMALEMIHCFTLIHDDLPCLDDDDFRRGLPSNHRVFGEAVALLSGDSLIPLAFELCLEARRDSNEQCWIRAFKRLLSASGPRGVIGGQALELTLPNDRSLDRLRKMHLLKTGALFDAAILIPADLAGLSPGDQKMETISRFSTAFGLAFQTADDLEDGPQEQDPKTGTYPNTNILHYMTESEARAQATDLLDLACEHLKKDWPETSNALLSLATQIQTALKN